MMRMPPFSLHAPGSLDEALSIAGGLAEAGHEFDWVAGGTDLLPNYKWHLNSKPHVISLARVSELSELTHTHIGAMVRLQDLVESDATVLQQLHRVCAEQHLPAGSTLHAGEHSRKVADDLGMERQLGLFQ